MRGDGRSKLTLELPKYSSRPRTFEELPDPNLEGGYKSDVWNVKDSVPENRTWNDSSSADLCLEVTSSHRAVEPSQGGLESV